MSTIQTMKAIIIRAFGEPEVMRLEEVERPVPGAGQVLIRVFAAGINPTEMHLRNGMKYIPEEKRPPLPVLPLHLGRDVAGVIESVGEGVTDWQIGEAVHGLIAFRKPIPAGSYGEYMVAPVEDLARKPTELSFAEAAALPLVGLTAWQALVDRLNIQPGQRVLIYGAAGGVGHLAVQIALAKGATVIAVASGRHEAYVRSLGIEHFVDYTTTDLSQLPQVDAVLECIGGVDIQQRVRLVRPGGSFAAIQYGPVDEQYLQDQQITRHMILVESSGEQLRALDALVAADQLRVTVAKSYPLMEAVQAHRDIETGKTRGKLVLQIAEE